MFGSLDLDEAMRRVDAADEVAHLLIDHELSNEAVLHTFAVILAQMTVKASVRDGEPVAQVLTEMMQRLTEYITPLAVHYTTCQCNACVAMRAAHKPVAN